ncbi:MAG: phage terminase large subunit [Rickettsiales bacterium]
MTYALLDWYDDIVAFDFPTFIGKTLSTVDPAAEYLPNWHIDLLAEYLEAARRNEISRLIINMPPRSLKSVCVSVAWPAWLLGKDPRSRIIAASYASSLSVKHSIDSRLVVTSEWYKKIFPDVKISRDQNEKYKFITTQRGYRLATSVGGSVTGEGGNYLIIDDPLNPAQAMNSLRRDAANRWFDHTFSSRLDDKRLGVIVLVMQRLHQHDLTGHLLAKGGWEHLCLPAVATERTVYHLGKVAHVREEGELLHSAREDEGLIARAKIEQGSSVFSAQYQQMPVVDDGEMVRPWWIGRYKAPPAHFSRIVQSWDTAIKTGMKNDSSACLTFGESDGKSYLLDVFSGKAEYPDLKRMFFSTATRFQPHVILIEDKASGQQLLQDVRRETKLPVVAINPKADKLTRFAAVSALIEAGRLQLPEQASWLADFEAELYAFPNGNHDDQVDALSQYLDWVRGETWNHLRIRNI